MNKKFYNFFCEKGLDVKNNKAYGIMEGYEVSAIVQTLSNFPFQMQICFYGSSEVRGRILADMEKIDNNYLYVFITPLGVDVGIKAVNLTALLKMLPEVLDQIFGVLKSNKALGVGYCPYSGKEIVEGRKVTIGWKKFTIEEESREEINAKIRQGNQEYDEAPNYYFRGILGALLGAAVGVISFIIIFKLNFISSISAFVAVFLGTYLYKRFGGKPTKTMLGIVSVISLLAMGLTVFFIYVNVAEQVTGYFGYSSTGLTAFNDMINVAEFKSEFLSNLFMTLFFSLIGIVAHVPYILKTVKRRKEIV